VAAQLGAEAVALAVERKLDGANVGEEPAGAARRGDHPLPNTAPLTAGLDDLEILPRVHPAATTLDAHEHVAIIEVPAALRVPPRCEKIPAWTRLPCCLRPTGRQAGRH
jgi:hypothetical protein